ncbi:MAG: TIM barrel protein [Phycisphaerae bacterium]|nr:TIM barrel protein [Phycisphaerae bacterium]
MTRQAQDLSRRSVLKGSLTGGTLLALRRIPAYSQPTGDRRLRLGGPVFEKWQDPQGWVDAVRRLGYRAAYCPVGPMASDDEVRAYEDAARKTDIVIAEVGAWSNPISPDESIRKAALEKCCTHLALADRIGARCCVNIAGSLGDTWDGPSARNFTQEAFDLIVQTTRSIIDAVKPTRTYYTLETMPWAYPDSADCYLRLFKAIDRKGFAVHLDPVNLVCSPQRYYGNANLIRECFEKLGPHIRSCHAKDILLQTKLTTHLDEVRPGTGGLDYAVFLEELSRFPGTPLMLEHLPNAEEYQKAADHVRTVAKGLGIFDLS